MPSEDAVTLRTLTNSDRILYLRTQNDWYEVDVWTEDGLRFRGWLKGNLPLERQPPPHVERRPDVSKLDPLRSEKYFWFWTGKLKETSFFKFNLGMVNIAYDLTGIQNSSRTNIFSYAFNGLSAGVDGTLRILEIPFFNRLFYWDANVSYAFGFFRLGFDNPYPEAPEVAGKGYEILTHTYAIDSLAHVEINKWKDGEFSTGLGLGFFHHEVAPDLEPLTQAPYAGQSIFINSSFSSTAIPIKIKARFFEDWRLQILYKYFLFPGLSEEATFTPNLSSSGFPLYFQTDIHCALGDHWGLSFAAEYFNVDGKGTGSSQRLDKTYSDGNLNLSFYRALLGVHLRY